MKLTVLVLRDRDKNIHGCAIVEFMASYAEAKWAMMAEALSLSWPDAAILCAQALEDGLEYKVSPTRAVRLKAVENQIETLAEDGTKTYRSLRYSDLHISLLVALFEKYSEYEIVEAQVLHVQRSMKHA